MSVLGFFLVVDHLDLRLEDLPDMVSAVLLIHELQRRSIEQDASHHLVFLVQSFCSLLPLSLGLVALGFNSDFVHVVILLTLVATEVVHSKEFADSKPDLSLSPLAKVFLFDLLELSWPELKNALGQEFILSLAPVVPFLDVEVFQI